MLPQDPIMLYSYLNLKLRDQYSSLSALCEDMDEYEQGIIDKMSSAGFIYDKERNQFR